jgi:tRNA U34 5-methylaminomethyl-2-thiouridine-forming methyltransferase MnmC
MNDIEIITTADGSHSLLNTTLNETYHSVHGALQESIHVFIKNGFDFVCNGSPVQPVRILEVGFGTGLNTLLAAESASAWKRSVHYTTLEAFPVEETIWSKLNYGQTTQQKEYFRKIHEAPWSVDTVLSDFFTLHKVKTTLQQAAIPNDCFDIIFYDAFAPNKQPEMWEFPVLEKVVATMKPGGVFVTYCARGQLKRDLKNLKMSVETLPGPPGKKEMVRALKI